MRPDTAFRVGPQIQVADRVIKEAHGTGGIFTVSDILARSSNVGAVRIGQRLGERRFDSWVRRFGFGRLTDLPLPGESAGIVPRVEGLLGLLDREPADRPGPRRHADADGRRLRGDRERRRAREAAAGARRRAAARAARDLRRARRRACGACSRACSGPTGTAPEAAVEGYDIAGKTGTAEKPEDGVYSKDKVVASFVGFAPAHEPAAAGRGDRGRAQGRALGRRGRRAGVREDRQLRAALPRTCPATHGLPDALGSRRGHAGRRRAFVGTRPTEVSTRRWGRCWPVTCVCEDGPTVEHRAASGGRLALRRARRGRA